MADENTPLLRDLKEVAETLRVGKTTVSELVRSGRLPTVNIGGRRLVRDEALRAFVASLDRESAAS